MAKFFFFLVILGLALTALDIAFKVALLILLLPVFFKILVLILRILVSIPRGIWYIFMYIFNRDEFEKKRAFQKEAKKHEKIMLQETEERERIKRLEVIENERKEKEAAEERERIKRLEVIENERKEKEAAEKKRIMHRDADIQDFPYVYECLGHPNRTLALRYGIANLKNEVKEYWFYGRGGTRQRNPEKDRVISVEATNIKLRKIKKVKEDDRGNHYIAELTDHDKRNVKVIIKPGEEFVSTFYPFSESWFKEHDDLELVLKNNKTFDLKELANFHVQKTIRGKAH